MAFKFIKTGEDSIALAKKAALQAEQYRDQKGRLWRFFLSVDEDAAITFVDGELINGFLVPPRWYEHNLYLNGNWGNYFVCPEQTNIDSKDKCPICESGDRPYLAHGFTIIDHRVRKSEKGNEYRDVRRLLVAKQQTFDMLNKHAMKRQGLACCTFDVCRTNDKEAAVGGMFDFRERRDRKELEKLYVKEVVADPKSNEKKIVSNFVVADYDSELTYKSGDELRSMGFGKSIPNTTVPFGPGANGDPTDYSKQL
jgi:hypothetical protein